MRLVPPSAKEQIVLAAERLFATRGLDGVSLREIAAAAGSGNHSAVQYHFGSKEQLVQAIFEFRLPDIDERRRILVAERPPRDLRSWLRCYILPILEQGEQRGSHYLSFIAMLQQYPDRDILERIPEEFGAATDRFREQMADLLADVPEPLRTHRISQALAFSVQAAAERERAQEGGVSVLPFSIHVADLLDGLVGFLQAPVSDIVLEGLDTDDVASAQRSLVP